jgi:hypothetical protein
MKRTKPSRRANVGLAKRIRPMQIRQTFGWLDRAKDYERKLGLAELRKNGLTKPYHKSSYRVRIAQAIEFEEEGIYNKLRNEEGRFSALRT